MVAALERGLLVEESLNAAAWWRMGAAVSTDVDFLLVLIYRRFGRAAGLRFPPRAGRCCACGS